MSPDLIGSSVDVVGTDDGQQGCTCSNHPDLCRQALVVVRYAASGRSNLPGGESVLKKC